MRKQAALILITCLAVSAFATTFTTNLVEKLNSSSPGELIPVMVTMKQQAEKNLMQSMTYGLDKQATREEVVRYLKCWMSTGPICWLQNKQGQLFKGFLPLLVCNHKPLSATVWQFAKLNLRT